MLLLHGFPTSSHMYRELIPALADRYHVVAPDLPGFGFTDRRIARSSNILRSSGRGDRRLHRALGLDRFAIYVFDYGAPVGFRLAMRHPERITAIISQNGNAYLEGLSRGLESDPGLLEGSFAENRAALRAFLTPETTQWQYTHGVQRRSGCRRNLHARLRAAGATRQRRDPARSVRRLSEQRRALSQFQDYFRTRRPPLLRSGAKTIRSSCPGAEAFKRDNPTPKFARRWPLRARKQAPEIAAIVRDFLARKLPQHAKAA